MGRLIGTTTTYSFLPNTPFTNSYSYDAFGNLTVTGNGQFQPGYNSSNQMIGPATYDADGNATSDEQHTYAWDADGQPVTIDGVAITYDALGQIVEEDKSGTYSELIYSPTGFKMHVLSGGSVVAAYAPMPGGGASVWTPSGFYYRHGDWLGSSRFASTKSQTVYYDAAYAPFGQSYSTTGTADNNFTGKDQGTVSGLYDFPAREYNGNEARWASPDPAGLASVNPADPQTWNRYAYVRNSPLGMTDPTGLAECGYYVSRMQNGDPGTYMPQECNIWFLTQYFGYGGFFSWDWGFSVAGGGGAMGGGGKSSPPAVNGKQPQSQGCTVLDPIFSGLEYTGKLGPEVELGPLKAGFSFYDNFTTGQSGAKGELNLGIIGIQGDVPTPPGGSLTGNQATQWTISIFGFQKNLTTGSPWQFSPSQTFGKLGLQVFVGGEVSLNTQTMNQQAKANEACIAKGGG